MPSRSYYRRLVDTFNSPEKAKSVYLAKTTIGYIVPVVVDPDKEAFNRYQRFIFDIIHTITTTLDLQLIRDRVKSLIGSDNIESICQLATQFDLIEQNICGILTNIGNCVNIDIIRCRIEYIRELISKLPFDGDDCPSYNYELIQNEIFGLIESVINSVDYNTIIANLRGFKIILNDQRMIYETYNIIEATILDIIKNIRDCVNIDIIRCRIMYLHELISDVVCPDEE
jgi:hypothetical protein